MDKLTREQRYRNMAANKSKGTKPELAFAKVLWGAGIRYRKNDKSVFGKPDFVIKGRKIAIFCDGEFWHGRNWEIRKNDHKSNCEFWYSKIERNIERDREVNAELERCGWKIFRFWDTEIIHEPEKCLNRILNYMKENCVIANPLLQGVHSVPFLPTDKPKFTFIDLFAGIGGFRLAMQHLGGKCVFSSEWDAGAQKTYLLNFGETPFGDITKESTKAFIPDGFDVLCAGFPCQAFSLAGRRLGFEETRGTLFFDVAEIIRRKRPKAFFLENVKGLLIHDKGRTIQTILKTLREDLDYYVPEPKVVNAMDFGVPQHRERVYIVGFRKDQAVSDFTYPAPTDTGKTFADVKEQEPVSVKYYLSTQYLKTLVAHKERHAAKGNGFGYEVISDDGVANAIVVGGMGRERNLVRDDRLEDFTPVTRIKGEVNREGLRRMTPREWARLQGFPDDFIIGVSDAAAYKQFGNSVAVPAIEATANQIIKRLNLSKTE